MTREPEFLARDERQWLLIRALAAVHPPSSTALAFWEDHCRPSAVYLSVAITALADNDSPEALALLERKMADEQIAAGLKIAWMRRAILSHRHEREMLHCCGRMLAAASDPELRRALVEALFDYQQSWYGSRPPEPIPLNAMDRQSRKILRIVGEHALKSVPLGAELRRKVECVLGEIRRTDETT